MYSGFGVFRATNKGGCNHDFFRCCKVHFVMAMWFNYFDFLPKTTDLRNTCFAT